MSQPFAIYASIPASSGANWLTNPPNTVPVTVTTPYSQWPSVDWSDGNISPLSGYGEVPQYLWSVPVPDPNDSVSKTFTRRLIANSVNSLPNIMKIPVGGSVGNEFSLIFSIAADDEYTFQLLINDQPLLGEIPTTGYNFQVPLPMPWRNVKTYSYGVGAKPVTINNGETLDIQTTVTNLPQPGPGNLAMVTWVLQLFSRSVE